MAKYETYLNENTHVHISTNGNRKLGKGVWNISLLPGDQPLRAKDGTQMTNIPGTCKGCCKECYSETDPFGKGSCYAVKYCLVNHLTCIPAYNDNTILAVHYPEIFFSEIQNALDHGLPRVVRFHVAGEIPSKKYLRMLAELAEKNPEVQFYIYTKRFKWVEAYLVKHEKFPDNLAVNLSIWHKNYANPYGLAEFIYDDGTDLALKEIPHCPAVDKKGNSTGVTCAVCRRCIYAKPGAKTAVYAH